MKLDAGEPADAERREAVFMLQPAELALDGDAAFVEVQASGYVPWDAG